jgi:hypothetical protein
MGRITPQQAASALWQTYFLAHGFSEDDKSEFGIPSSMVHFHGQEGYGIAWNDVMSTIMWNAAMNDSLPVPLTATQGYNQHGHTGPYDGGWIAGRGVHDHSNNFNGGFAFAVFHPGTSLPQQPWAL